MNTSINTLHVDILDVDRLLYSGPCVCVVAPAAFGEVCIYPRHSPLLSRLNSGEVRLKMEDGSTRFYFVAGGFMEVSYNIVSILADRSLRAQEIDKQAALEARQRAEAALKTSPLFTDRDAALAALTEALIKLRILEHAEHRNNRSGTM
ncbi:MAG: ATP synthase F1 subunit epsilon [Methylococcaceae bacterium]